MTLHDRHAVTTFLGSKSSRAFPQARLRRPVVKLEPESRAEFSVDVPCGSATVDAGVAVPIEHQRPPQVLQSLWRTSVDGVGLFGGCAYPSNGRGRNPLPAQRAQPVILQYRRSLEKCLPDLCGPDGVVVVREPLPLLIVRPTTPGLRSAKPHVAVNDFIPGFRGHAPRWLRLNGHAVMQ